MKGSYFGEIEMFKSCSRQHYVNALEETDVLLLPKDIFIAELKNFSKEEEIMYLRAIERDILNKKTANQIGRSGFFNNAKSTFVKLMPKTNFGLFQNTRTTKPSIF